MNTSFMNHMNQKYIDINIKGAFQYKDIMLQIDEI